MNKLTLSRETLTRLSSSEAEGVVAGTVQVQQPVDGDSNGNTVCVCSDFCVTKVFC